ncbi:MAG: hypothetical protein LBT64_02410, partial [Puniceicoccales bacterium]|nr:hypothetical protein [Puniceicoccales bacterium]
MSVRLQPVEVDNDSFNNIQRPGKPDISSVAGQRMNGTRSSINITPLQLKSVIELCKDKNAPADGPQGKLALLAKFAQLAIAVFISRNIFRDVFHCIFSKIARRIAAKAQSAIDTLGSNDSDVKHLRKSAYLSQLRGEALLIAGDKRGAMECFAKAQAAHVRVYTLSRDKSILSGKIEVAAKACENAHGLLAKICDITDDIPTLHRSIKQMVNIFHDVLFLEPPNAYDGIGSFTREFQNIIHKLQVTEENCTNKLAGLLPAMEISESNAFTAIEVFQFTMDRLHDSLELGNKSEEEIVAIGKTILSLYSNFAKKYETWLSTNPGDAPYVDPRNLIAFVD